MTWVIAHRGASMEEKENTLPAFERAIELGVGGIFADRADLAHATLSRPPG